MFMELKRVITLFIASFLKVQYKVVIYNKK